MPDFAVQYGRMFGVGYGLLLMSAFASVMNQVVPPDSFFQTGPLSPVSGILGILITFAALPKGRLKHFPRAAK